MTEKMKIVDLLIEHYPHVKSPLNSRNEFEFLICVILSAQTRDDRVNEISPLLFSKYETPEKLSLASLEDLENILHPLGFYRNKAKNIKATAEILHNEYQDKIPHEFKDLLSLKGVGRKTANVIRGHVTKDDAIIVDTHFTRVSRRLNLQKEKNPTAIEKSFKNWVPKKKQFLFSMSINQHGRILCKAKKPLCEKCFLQMYCTYYKRVFLKKYKA